MINELPVRKYVKSRDGYVDQKTGAIVDEKEVNGQVVDRSVPGRTRVYTVNQAPDMAQSQYEKECDVTQIMKKADATGQLTHLAAHQGTYVDLVGAPDFMEMNNKVIRAQQAFMTLPAELRAKCNNDPAQFLAMLADSKNDEELIRLGVKAKPIPKQTDLSDVVDAIKASQAVSDKK